MGLLRSPFGRVKLSAPDIPQPSPAQTCLICSLVGDTHIHDNTFPSDISTVSVAKEITSAPLLKARPFHYLVDFWERKGLSRLHRQFLVFQPMPAEAQLFWPDLALQRLVCCNGLHERTRVLPPTLPLSEENSPNCKSSCKLLPCHLAGWRAPSSVWPLHPWARRGVGGAGDGCFNCSLCHQD